MSGLIHHPVHLVFFSVRLVFFLGYQAHNFIMVLNDFRWATHLNARLGSTILRAQVSGGRPEMSGPIHHPVHLVFFSVRLVFFLGYQAHNFIMV